MTSVLIDDTKSSSATSYGSEFSRELGEIAKYRIDRFRAYEWAQNLRFLCFDDSICDDEQNDTAIESGVKCDSSTEGDHIAQEAVGTCRRDPPIWKDGQGINPIDENGSPINDTLDEQESADSDSESAMLDYAIAMSLAEEQDLQPHDGVSTTGADTTVHPHETTSCATCLKYPAFPTRPRKFRVVRFSEEDLSNALCGHYVAVSYCWNSDEHGKPIAPQRSYTVHDESAGTNSRANRAPDNIIDRAVDCARAVDARLIWLDQECLPQDESEEHELGIQAMDMVFQRAEWCVGLVDSIIPSQTQMDAVASVLDWASNKDHAERALRIHSDSTLTGAMIPDQLMDFLELFAADKWNTRAWILQEAFSASGNLILAMRTAPSIVFRGGSELKVNPNMMPGVFAIGMNDMTSFIQASKEFLHMCARLHTPSGVAISSMMISQINEDRMFGILNGLEYIHPWPSATANRHAYMYAIGGPHYGARKTCNAATAVTFLRSRFNHRPADRLAILANLTDYEIRLDTAKIEQRFKSLSVCLFALAYMNGDLSLLTPEVYQRAKVQAPIEGPYWILPVNEVFDSTNATYLRAGYALILRNPRRYNFSASGAIMPAYVWNVNRKVNLKFIRRKWEHFWKKWTCIKMTMKLRENESIEEFQRRQERIHDLLAKGQYDSDALKALLDNEKPLDWNNIGFDDQNTSTHVSRILSTARLEQDKSAQWMLGNLFKEILEYLCDIDEVPLANSIWHTIRSDCVNGNMESRPAWSQSHWDALPDNVIDLFLTDEFKRNPFWQMQLDRNNQGTFNQVWIIDRVMRDGFLWVGNYVPITSNIQPENDASRDCHRVPKLHEGNTEEDRDGKAGLTKDTEDTELASRDDYNTSQTSTATNTQLHNDHRRSANLSGRKRPPLFQPTYKEELFMSALLHGNQDYKDAFTDGIRMAPKPRHDTGSSNTLLPILTLQTFKLLSAMIFRSDCFRISRGMAAKKKAALAATAAGNAKEGNDNGDIDENDYPTNLLQGVFMSHLLLRNVEMETQDKKLSERVSVFDVDGPCMVATAHDADMERLPRSVIRSMDTAWVVELIHKGKETLNSLAPSRSTVIAPLVTTTTIGECDDSNGDSFKGPKTLASGEIYHSIASQDRPDGDQTEWSEPDLSSLHIDSTAREHKEQEHTGVVNDSDGKIRSLNGNEELSYSPDDYCGDATFRVLNRVRGAWEIMEENWHEYEFV